MMKTLFLLTSEAVLGFLVHFSHVCIDYTGLIKTAFAKCHVVKTQLYVHILCIDSVLQYIRLLTGDLYIS